MKELCISIKLPEDLPADDESLRDARRAALEGAVLKLWQAGRLSTRAAAKRLRLGYHDYLDLLGQRGIPVLTELPDEPKIHQLVEKVKARG